MQINIYAFIQWVLYLLSNDIAPVLISVTRAYLGPLSKMYDEEFFATIVNNS